MVQAIAFETLGRHNTLDGRAFEKASIVQSISIDTPTALFKFEQTSSYIGMGRSRIYQLIADGEFPPPIKIGKSSRWLKVEIDAWIEQQAAQRIGA